MLLIKNGLIHDAVNREPYIADILVDEGKIVKIEKDIEACCAQVYDATGLEVYPGFVEAHCHTGLHGYGCAPSTPSSPVTRRWPKPAKPASPHCAPAPAAPTCWAVPSPLTSRLASASMTWSSRRKSP